MTCAESKRDPLKSYRAKRQFNRTPEPQGRAQDRSCRRKRKTYSIQKHAARNLHYDLRLELDGVLKSWALTRGPSLDPSRKRLAMRTEDHPLDYAAFEGKIPEGNYGAGTVLLWDRGTWEPLDDPHDGLEKGRLSFKLQGKRLRGRWALVRFRLPKSGDRESWLFIKADDAEADYRRDVTAQYETSVASGRAIEEIAGEVGRTEGKASQNPGKVPDFVQPTLATLVDEVPRGDDWLFEVKFDGYRALSAVSGGKVRIYTRNGLDWTDRFPVIAECLSGLNLHGVLIDGEIVAIDKAGRSSFAALQRALKGDGKGLAYFVFDLLEERSKSMQLEPLRKRKERLLTLLKDVGRKGPIFVTDHVERDGSGMLNRLCRKGYEGIIAKRASARYRSGRKRDWLKIKCRHEQEFVIVGWSPTQKDRPFASLFLGIYEKGNLRYAGRVGTGFSQDELSSLGRRLDKLSRKSRPVTGQIPRAIANRARWVKPELVAQIAFTDFTGEGLVRQGRFLGLREDKPAKGISRELSASSQGG